MHPGKAERRAGKEQNNVSPSGKLCFGKQNLLEKKNPE